MSNNNPVIVIGGGWSGLAAAISLSQQGHAVHVIEAAKHLGGRARNVEWQDTIVDNGQHLMIGAYNRMLAMMTLIGVDVNSSFNRQTMDIELHDPDYQTLLLSAMHQWLPWPLSLAANIFKSAGIGSLISIARLQRTIPYILNSPDIQVSEWLIQTEQSPRLIRQLWEPLCLATLNTPIEEASAHLLATVVRDSLGQGKSSADALIPKQPLGDIFPQFAADYIQQNGGKISLQTRVKQINVSNNKVTGVQLNNGTILESEHVIVACNPSSSVDLLRPYLSLVKPADYPICTLYLQYPPHTRLSKPMLGMSGTMSQWVFDRSEQSPGLMAVVISGPGHHQALNNETLCQQVSEELAAMFVELAQPITNSLVIREKRATFASQVNVEQQRPKSKTAISGLWLAGDYVANGYPATLEGAIRNGEQCAQHIAAQRFAK
jgi:squalene-associated FAD-dependent desaturase